MDRKTDTPTHPAHAQRRSKREDSPSPTVASTTTLKAEKEIPEPMFSFTSSSNSDGEVVVVRPLSTQRHYEGKKLRYGLNFCKSINCQVTTLLTSNVLLCLMAVTF